MKSSLPIVLLAVFTLLFMSCKQDDGNGPAPPRDYAVQYATEKIAIEDYLQTHRIVNVDLDADIIVTFEEIEDGNPNGYVSIWDQTAYPLQFKDVLSNGVTYRVYYLKFQEGIGESPTRADNVLTAYTGMTLTGVQFDINPFPQNYSFLSDAIEGWREIIPLFKTGVYVDGPSPNPASFTDFGAGVMFLPSGLAYYNNILPNVSAYSTMYFSFKLYDLEYLDVDNDGILNKDEKGAFDDIEDNDTDGDGIPNYLDRDDDGDGFLTRDEIRIPGTNTLYEFENIPPCTTGGVPLHLDPSCNVAPV